MSAFTNGTVYGVTQFICYSEYNAVLTHGLYGVKKVSLGNKMHGSLAGYACCFAKRIYIVLHIIADLVWSMYDTVSVCCEWAYVSVVAQIAVMFFISPIGILYPMLGI